ncbi:MAG: TetR/AcrR family transcriptional regulator [Betaproteobacteria bacterium]|nr:TetR/AcrR family transcriptional regulator [Betaproteobacteria bacterium]
MKQPKRAASAVTGTRRPSQMPKLQPLKTEVQEFKRRRILEEARDLFYAAGYEATTLDAIAETLKVTKPFLYSYFKNKSEILNAICEVGIRSSLKALDDALQSSLPPREKLRVMVERVTSIVLQSRKYIVVYEREEKNLGRPEAATLMSLRRQFGVRLAEMLKEGNSSGDFDVPDPLLTAVSIGGLITWVASWYRPAGRWSQTEVIVHMIRNVDGMVAHRTPGKGGKPV